VTFGTDSKKSLTYGSIRRSNISPLEH